MKHDIPVGNQAIKGRCHEWRELLRTIKPNGSSHDLPKANVTDQREILKAARQIGLKIKTRKLDGGGLRIWRIK